MADDKKSVVCIIPAYNEEGTVADIASLAVNHFEINKVLVVDDGSEDATSERVSRIDGVKILRLDKNSGKGAAMHAGLAASEEPYILFLDADLIGMKENHVTDLLEPVIHGNYDMSVGLFRGGRIHTDLAHIVTPSLSGQRTIRREVIENLDMDSVGFGIERALTELWEARKIRVRDVILKGVTHRTKEEKRGYIEGVKQRMGMYSDILKFEGNKLKRKMNKK
jgi:glycosyltransferase involved in cell wall biosynthesis